MSVIPKATVLALVQASDAALSRGCWGDNGWVPGRCLMLPARDRSPPRLMRLVDAGLAEHEIRSGYSLRSCHHYWRATDAARAMIERAA